MCREEMCDVMFPDCRRSFVGGGDMPPVVGNGYTFKVLERNAYCDDSASGWTIRNKIIPDVREVIRLTEEDEVFFIKTEDAVYFVTIE